VSSPPLRKSRKDGAPTRWKFPKAEEAETWATRRPQSAIIVEGQWTGTISLLDNSEKFFLLNRAKYLYLREICEPRDNSLRLVVEEAVVSNRDAGSQDSWRGSVKSLLDAGILDNSQAMESSYSCKTFELLWKH